MINSFIESKEIKTSKKLEKHNSKSDSFEKNKLKGNSTGFCWQMNFTSLIKESKETHENSMNLTNPMNLMSPSRENKYMMINNANKYESPHIEVGFISYT